MNEVLEFTKEALWLVLLCGIGIVAIQFCIVAGLLPAVG